MYNDDGETPLHVAMRLQFQPHVVMEMLRNGADVNRETREADMSLGSEPMKISDSIQQEEIYNNQNGKSSFQYMLVYYKRNSLSVVREMLKYGADPFQIDTQGRNSFHIITTMIASDSFKVLLLLLNHFENSEVDKSIPDILGNIPLYYECSIGDFDDGYCSSLRASVICILLATRWDITMSNSLGQTPFHLLVHQYHQFTNNLKPEKERCLHNIVAIMSIFLAEHVDLSIIVIKDMSDTVAKILEDNQFFKSQFKIMSDEMEQYKSRINILENELAFTNRDLELTKQNAKDTNNRVKVLERELLLTKEMSKTSAEIPTFDKDDLMSPSHSKRIRTNVKNRSDDGYEKDAMYQEFNMPDNSEISKEVKRILCKSL
ncbi:ANK [Mytilus edulis]|uniref:ANK n=1 Tax=Mytilus edulis TaxID=6550 RepID=A0A8S3S7M1_MYTED|nr:ANK [Mytilus edulis]